MGAPAVPGRVHRLGRDRDAALIGLRRDAHPERDEIELAALLHALSDKVRLQIVAALANAGEVPCGSIALPVTKSTSTHHFKVLREAGVIQQRQEGTTRLTGLRRDDLEARFPGLLATILAATAAGPDH